MDLCKVVDIDQKKCTNCHVCISVCPIKYCMIDDYTVKIDPNLCIGCGRCYKACPFDAINIVDDFNEFLTSINSAKRVMLIVSPSYIVNYKADSKKFIGWLKKNFILEGVFDESLGAEISAILHSEYLIKTKKIPVLTQQCPTIIEYIKMFHPNLINHIAPIFSPTIILAKLIRKLLNYKGIIAFLGSCLSKKREFNEQKFNDIIQYNITFDSITKYISKNNIDINKFEESEFDFIPAENARVFCKPGGFNNVIKKYNKTADMFNIEGEIIYDKYFKDLIENVDKNYEHIPNIIDSLNCEGGCYRGPGIINDLTINEENWLIKESENEAINIISSQFKNQKIYNKILNENRDIAFNRNYSAQNQNSIFTLSNEELKNAYNDLKKNEKIDFLNCRSCGFKTCQEFSTSYFFKLNKNFNCRVYFSNSLNKELNEVTVTLDEMLIKIDKIYQNSSDLNQYINNLKNVFDLLKTLVENIINFNKNLNENTEKFQPIIAAISDVSEQINLLSFNASIEASRTGEAGKGFTVVASEIRNLADKTKIEIDKINSIIDIILNSSIGINTNSTNLNERNKYFSTNFQALTNLIDIISSNVEILYNSSKKNK